MKLVSQLVFREFITVLSLCIFISRWVTYRREHWWPSNFLNYVSSWVTGSLVSFVTSRTNLSVDVKPPNYKLGGHHCFGLTISTPLQGHKFCHTQQILKQNYANIFSYWHYYFTIYHTVSVGTDVAFLQLPALVTYVLLFPVAGGIFFCSWDKSLWFDC